MVRSLYKGFALLFVSAGLLMVGCQDSVVDPSSDGPTTSEPAPSETSSSVPMTPTVPESEKMFGFCDVVVGGTQTIQDAVDGAGSGDVICVTPGTYEEQVTVDQSVTIRGKGPAFFGPSVVIDGWVSLDADGAALKRVVVTRDDPFSTPGGFTPDPFGIRITASNTTVSQNVVHSIGEDVPDGSINGIQAFGANTISDVEIKYNLVRDYQNVEADDTPASGVAGIKVQADVSDVTVRGNVVRDLHGLYGYGVVLTSSTSADGVPSNVHVDYNTLARINDGSVFDVFGAGGNEGRDAPGPYPGSAVAIDGEAEADAATVRFNNLLTPNGAESKDQSESLTATCNWWDDRSGPTHSDNPGGDGTWALERGTADIEYTPWLIAPSPSHACIGGDAPGFGRGGSGHGASPF